MTRRLKVKSSFRGVRHLRLEPQHAPLWSCAPHTAAKHRVLGEYLKGWFPKLSSTYRKVVVIDGFAGPGEYLGGLDGSPAVILKAIGGHRLRSGFGAIEVFLCEPNTVRAHNLARVVARLQPVLPSDTTCHVARCSFEEAVRGPILQRFEGESIPVFAFVDPFGVKGAAMAVLSDMMKLHKPELLVHWSWDTITRRSLNPQTKYRDQFTRFFGTAEWEQAVGEPDSASRKEYLQGLYDDQLHRAGAKFTKWFTMRDRNNRHIYSLVFATTGLEGLEVMKAAMYRVDPSGNFTFSDRMAARQQPMLPGVEPDWSDYHARSLSHLLVARLRESAQTIDEIENWVIANTDYCRPHVRSALWMLKDALGERLTMTPIPPRRGACPSGTRIILSDSR